LKLRITSAAQADLAEALRWYRQRGPGLDRRLLAAFDTALETIAAHPEIGPVVEGTVRRHLLRGFPYGVFYFATKDEVVVVGCFHGARDPDGR
jgi:plasmid stabilization system protein ParE